MLKWVRDPMMDNGLKRIGIEFELVRGYKVADVNIEVSKAAQSRGNRGVNDDHALTLSMAMIAPGAVFLMTVLNMLKRCPTIVVSGLHRIIACIIADVKTIDAYVLSCTDDIKLDMLATLANIWPEHSPLTMDEKLAKVAYMVEHHSVAMKDLATEFAVPYSLVNTYLRQNECNLLLSGLGIDTGAVSRTNLGKLFMLRHDTKVLSEVAKFVVQHTLKGEKIDQFIAEVRSQETQPEKLSSVMRWEREYSKKPPGSSSSISRPVRSHLLGLMRQFTLLIESITSKRGGITFNNLQLTQEDLPILVDFVNLIESKLKKAMRDGK
jgi:hypothetical protein